MEKKIVLKSKLETKPFHMAPVEIIIPFHDEQTRLSKLVDSIFNTVSTNRYLITLVDDFSKNRKFVPFLNDSKTPGLRCLSLPEHRGFGAAVNYALDNPWRKMDITWVCIMHSDVFVDESSWLSNLGESLIKLKASGVKMISPVTNNPVVENSALEASKESPRQEDFVLKEGFLPMYCALAHRELFKRVGPLAECPYAGTEAEDYARRMKSKGYYQAVCGKSWVHHDGRATISQYDEDEYVQKILRNTREQYFPTVENQIVQV